MSSSSRLCLSVVFLLLSFSSVLGVLQQRPNTESELVQRQSPQLHSPPAAPAPRPQPALISRVDGTVLALFLGLMTGWLTGEAAGIVCGVHRPLSPFLSTLAVCMKAIMFVYLTTFGRVPVKRALQRAPVKYMAWCGGITYLLMITVVNAFLPLSVAGTSWAIASPLLAALVYGTKRHERGRITPQ